MDKKLIPHLYKLDVVNLLRLIVMILFSKESKAIQLKYLELIDSLVKHG